MLEGESKPTENVLEVPQEMILQVSEMGFTQNQARKALRQTKNNVEAAIEWLFNNPNDTGEDEKPPSSSSSSQVPQELIVQVSELGFTHNQARKALKQTKNNVEAAVEWLFNNPNDPGEDENVSPPSNNQIEFDKSDAKFKLVGFILHKGTSPQMGHYVCYLRRDDSWVCYDDSRVQLSENPPFHSAFIYIWKRV